MRLDRPTIYLLTTHFCHYYYSMWPNSQATKWEKKNGKKIAIVFCKLKNPKHKNVKMGLHGFPSKVTQFTKSFDVLILLHPLFYNSFSVKKTPVSKSKHRRSTRATYIRFWWIKSKYECVCVSITWKLRIRFSFSFFFSNVFITNFLKYFVIQPLDFLKGKFAPVVRLNRNMSLR